MDNLPSKNIKDMTGQRFTMLTVLAFAGSDQFGSAEWLCRCDCGKDQIMRGQAVGILSER